jgi:RNA polymerase sigma-70 factor (ECF subfamily)
MTSSLPFAELMESLRRGDPNVARDVFERYARRLIGMAGARLPAFARSKVDPEDVVQSVFRTFFRRHSEGEFRPEHWDALWSLLTVLTARKCGHHLEYLVAARRDARREAKPYDSCEAGSAQQWEPEDPAPSPEEAALLSETLGQVLFDLSDRERSVLILRLQGHPIVEVANLAAASERSVHRILANVRAKLEALASL